jgi:hypothetical protein
MAKMTFILRIWQIGLLWPKWLEIVAKLYAPRAYNIMSSIYSHYRNLPLIDHTKVRSDEIGSSLTFCILSANIWLQNMQLGSFLKYQGVLKTCLNYYKSTFTNTYICYSVKVTRKNHTVRPTATPMTTTTTTTAAGARRVRGDNARTCFVHFLLFKLFSSLVPLLHPLD